jgi:hypothetical protein
MELLTMAHAPSSSHALSSSHIVDVTPAARTLVPSLNAVVAAFAVELPVRRLHGGADVPRSAMSTASSAPARCIARFARECRRNADFTRPSPTRRIADTLASEVFSARSCTTSQKQKDTAMLPTVIYLLGLAAR